MMRLFLFLASGLLSQKWNLKINTMMLWYSISILGVLPNGFMPVELAGLIGQFVENPTTKEENIKAALQLFREIAES